MCTACSWLKLFNADEDSAKQETRRHVQDGNLGYSNADVVVKLHGWDADHAKSVAQASLSALKQLILSDKKLPGTDPSHDGSLYFLCFILR